MERLYLSKSSSGLCWQFFSLRCLSSMFNRRDASLPVRSFCHTCNSLFANKLDKPSSCLLSTNSFSNWLLDQLLNPKSISVTIYTRWKCFSSGQGYVFFILSEATCATFHMSYKSIHSCRGCSFSCMESFHIKTCPTNYKTIKTDRPLWWIRGLVHQKKSFVSMSRQANLFGSR